MDQGVIVEAFAAGKGPTGSPCLSQATDNCLLGSPSYQPLRTWLTGVNVGCCSSLDRCCTTPHRPNVTTARTAPAKASAAPDDRVSTACFRNNGPARPLGWSHHHSRVEQVGVTLWKPASGRWELAEHVLVQVHACWLGYRQTSAVSCCGVLQLWHHGVDPSARAAAPPVPGLLMA